jgi:hypothetical protein
LVRIKVLLFGVTEIAMGQDFVFMIQFNIIYGSKYKDKAESVEKSLLS